MSTSTPTAHRPEAPVPGPAGPGRSPAGARLSFGGVLRSEWIKFRSLRSHWILLAVALLLALGFAALSASSALTLAGTDELIAQQMAAESGLSLPEGMGFVEYLAISSANGGLQLVMLLVGALAVLGVGAEYATGSIRTTMTAVPRRTPVMLAKVLVLSGVAFVFGVLSALLCHLLVQPILAGEGLGYDLGQEAVLLNVLAVGLFHTVTAWLGFGLGALLRSTTWGIVVLVVLLLVLQVVLFALRFDWVQDLRPWFPGEAGTQLTTMYQSADAELSHVQSGLVYGAWGLALVLAGVLVTKRRGL